MTAAAALYVGDVVHKRARPKRHALRYRVFSLLVDLDRLDEIDRSSRLLSVNRFNLFSLMEKDFGPRDGTSLADFARRRARAAGLRVEVARVEMLCYPRLLGYAFNPITVYYLRDAADRLAMLIYEVRNTFGEHHFYDAIVGDEPGEVTHTLPKAFYVSPFNTLEGRYRFTIRPPAERVFTGITLNDDKGALVTAFFDAARQTLSDRALLRLAITFPLMTLKVVAGIHIEALRLYMKGVPITLGMRPRHGTPHV